MEEQVAQLLLAEFRAFRDTEFREFKDDVANWREDSASRLGVLETQVKTGITGNGQPSRMAVIEKRQRSLERTRWYFYGAAAMLAYLLEQASHWLPWGKR